MTPRLVCNLSIYRYRETDTRLATILKSLRIRSTMVACSAVSFGSVSYTHLDVYKRQGLKVIIDFVPNHVARQYHSDAQPDGTTELGANDDSSQSFSPVSYTHLGYEAIRETGTESGCKT